MGFLYDVHAIATGLKELNDTQREILKVLNGVKNDNYIARANDDYVAAALGSISGAMIGMNNSYAKLVKVFEGKAGEPSRDEIPEEDVCSD